MEFIAAFAGAAGDPITWLVAIPAGALIRPLWGIGLAALLLGIGRLVLFVALAGAPTQGMALGQMAGPGAVLLAAWGVRWMVSRRRVKTTA